MVGEHSNLVHKKIWVKKKKWLENLAATGDDPESTIHKFEHGPLNDKVADLMTALVEEEQCVQLPETGDKKKGDGTEYPIVMSTKQGNNSPLIPLPDDSLSKTVMEKIQKDKPENTTNDKTKEAKLLSKTEQDNSGESKGYDLRPRNKLEDNMHSTGGLSHSNIPKKIVGCKSFLNKAQLQAAREITEGNQATIG